MADKIRPQGPQEGSIESEGDNESSFNQRGSFGNVNLKPRRPDFNQIHALPLPLTVYPLPTLIPHNPLSLLHIAFVYLRQLIWMPSSVPKPRYSGYFSSETRSVHVTDPRSVRALWEHGFFGKGSLSRSEPTWLYREKKKLGLLTEETAEDRRSRRREERSMFKLERARKEREAIDKTRKGEESGISNRGPLQPASNDIFTSNEVAKERRVETSSSNAPETGQNTTSANLTLEATKLPYAYPIPDATLISIEEPPDEEYLQLHLEEAFFLAFALGALKITQPNSTSPIPTEILFQLFTSHFNFPPSPLSQGQNTPLDASDPFLLSYATYHHFRSLGWVVRPGIKFGVDWLLYLKGPPFTHAEFSVVVVPSFSHEYWRDKEKGKKWPWHTLHGVNRVQSQVHKTLVLCYVEVPPPLEPAEGDSGGIGRDVDGVRALLRRYKIREFAVRRWVANRMRD